MNGCYETLELTSYPYYVSTFQLITVWLNQLGIQFPYQTILLPDKLRTLVHRWNLDLITIRSYTRSILTKRKKSFGSENGASKRSDFNKIGVIFYNLNDC